MGDRVHHHLMAPQPQSLTDVTAASEPATAEEEHSSSVKRLEVLADPNLVHKILLNGASTELRLAHRIFMIELCDARLGSTARQARDELQACLRGAIAQLFSDGQHREATEILVEHTMLISPGADREKMLEGRKFDERGELVHWNLSFCKISQLPESFCALVCHGDLFLSDNQLQWLPDGFGNITVGGYLNLGYNQLTEYPSSFPNVKGPMF